MKNLLATCMSAFVFVFAARAAIVVPSGTSFENMADGEQLSFTAGDSGAPGSNRFWWRIPAYSSSAKAKTYVGDDKPSGDRPLYFSSSTANTKCLTLEGLDKLYRTIGANAAVRPFEPCAMSTGVYLDTFVKFSAAPFVDPTEPDDKIFVWLRIDEQGQGAQATLQTNLVVTAGYLFADNRAWPREYVITHLGDSTVASSFNPNVWHRLTVKSISEISDDKTAQAAGFVVFVDGKPARAVNQPKGEAGSYLDRLNPLAAKWSEKGALFPSIWSPKDLDGQALTAAAFLGKGAIDDISFNVAQLTFAADTKAIAVRCTDPHVRAVFCRIGSGAQQQLTFTDGEAVVSLGTAASYQVEVSATYEGGYARGNWRYDGEVTSASSFTVTSFGTVVVASRGDSEVCKVDGLGHVSLDEAFASVRSGAATITLSSDITSGAYGEVAEDASITLDLAGHTLKGGDFVVTSRGQTFVTGAVIDNWGSLTIIDSSAGKTGRIVASDPEQYVCVWTAGGSSLVIEGGTYDGEILDGTDPRYDAESPAVISLAGGKYKPFGEAPTTAFYLADYVADGAHAAYGSGYWAVTGPSATVARSAKALPPGVAPDPEAEPGAVTGEAAVGEESAWDVPSANGGGLKALDDGHGRKSFGFTALTLTPTGATVGVMASWLDADGEVFGLICKTSLGSAETVVLDAKLSAERGATTGVFTITADLSAYEQLFVIGIGQAAGK